MSKDRLNRRLDLMKELEAPLARTGAGPLVKDHQTLYDQTAQMVLSPRTKAFRLDQEPDRMRDGYGRSAFGQGCLMARRLDRGGRDVRRGAIGRLGHARQRTGRV